MRNKEFLILYGPSAARLCRGSHPVLCDRRWGIRQCQLWHQWQFPVEAAFGENLTARIEYLYMPLQNSSCTNAANCGLDAPGVAANDTVKFSTSMIRLGLDYKFR